MRVAFVGASRTTLRTAEFLIKRGHEIIIIESDSTKVDEFSENLDCSFLLGDGSKPEILKEVDPKHTDVLFCLTNDDKDNLIASLVGRSLGFKRVVTRIETPEFEPICRELGLQDIIVPSRTISHYLEDLIRGVDALELSSLMKDEARFFSFIVSEEDAVEVADLKLPENAKAIYLYRDNKFCMTDESTKLKVGDNVIILTQVNNLEQLKERWNSA
jgi:trk system potassium uptake protein TrkA